MKIGKSLVAVSVGTSGFVASLALVAVSGLISSPARADSGCDHCPKPSIAVYDFDATKFRPEDTSASNPAAIDYLELFFASGGFFNEAFNSDTKHACTRLIDTYFNPATVKVSQPDAFHPSLPDTGPSQGTDYLVEGWMTGKPGDYILSVSLEDATSRDEIVSRSTHFATAGEALDAGKLLEAKMATLFDHIRDYQKRLREAHNDIAISAEFEIKPNKDRILAKESTPVEILLHDCDGVPLKNRKAKIRVDGPAKLDVSEFTTDDQGKATVKLSGTGSGIATIYANYEYTSVVHKNAHANHGWATVQVDDPLSDTWEITIDSEQQSSSSTHTQSPGYYETNSSQSQVSFHQVAWLKVEGFDPSELTLSIRSTDLVAIGGSGNASSESSYFGYYQTNPRLNWVGKRQSEGVANWTAGVGKVDLSFALSFSQSGEANSGNLVVAANSEYTAHNSNHYEKKWHGFNAPTSEVNDTVLDDPENYGLSGFQSFTPTAQQLKNYHFVIEWTDSLDDGKSRAIAHHLVKLKPLKKSETR